MFLLSRLIQPRGLKFALSWFRSSCTSVEAYTASWIEIVNGMPCKRACGSRLIQPRGLKSYPKGSQISFPGVEAYTASWIEMLHSLCIQSRRLPSRLIQPRGLKFHAPHLPSHAYTVSRLIQPRGLKFRGNVS